MDTVTEVEMAVAMASVRAHAMLFSESVGLDL